MGAVIATAGGFHGHYGSEPPSYTLAPHAEPRLLVYALVGALVVWAWRRRRAG